MGKYLDQFDYRIIVRLLEDGRTTFSALGKELGITDVAIKKRYERLINKGIIKKVSVDLDYKSLGIEGQLLIMLKIDPVVLNKTILLFQEDDFVKTIYKSVGDFNLTIIYLLKDLTYLNNLEKTLNKIKGILDFKFLTITDKPYEKHNIPLSSLQVYYK